MALAICVQQGEVHPMSSDHKIRIATERERDALRAGVDAAAAASGAGATCATPSPTATSLAAPAGSPRRSGVRGARAQVGGPAQLAHATPGCEAPAVE